MKNMKNLFFVAMRRHDDCVLDLLCSWDEGTARAVFNDYDDATAYVNEANNKDPESYHYVCVRGW
jgi:hypothetical protein